MTAVAEQTFLRERAEVSARFFPARAEEIARLCHRMSERFLVGGRLLAFGASGPARSDARHVAVEFVHPVIVGKRALPALALTDPYELSLLAEPEDIVMAFEGGAPVERLRRRGCLTVGFSRLGAEWEIVPPTEDRFIAQEIVETAYHVLWELVHVFFEHAGRQTQDAGAASFLYPFLASRPPDHEALIADVRESVLMKADDVQRLRERTVLDGADQLAAAARLLRDSFAGGGRLLALGNGGSATDATDLVADFVCAGRPAIDLTADSAIITAVANDIGSDAIFARQVIAYGRPGDVLIALSTSGHSPSMISALVEARRRGLATVALVGYDGGRVAAEAHADEVVITPSQHIPRIQEAQATAYHLLREMAVNEGVTREPRAR
jgi:D-sedoheptulose 7-phosphate isomerase